MKKLIPVLFLCAFAFASYAKPDASAPDSAPRGKTAAAPMSKAELKAMFKTNVVKQEGGDVLVDISKVEVKEVKGPKIGASEAFFLSYVDKDLDVAKLSEMIAKADGKKRGGNISLDALFGAIGKYLAPKNMNLQKMPFSENNISQRIDEGLPILILLASSDAYSEISARTQTRKDKVKDAAGAKAWGAEVGKKFVKIKNREKRIFSSGLICGYNPATDEFLVFGLESEMFWIHSKEIKQVFHSAYSLRF